MRIIDAEVFEVAARGICVIASNLRTMWAVAYDLQAAPLIPLCWLLTSPFYQ